MIEDGEHEAAVSTLSEALQAPAAAAAAAPWFSPQLGAEPGAEAAPPCGTQYAPKDHKLYWRRATALEELGRLRDALTDSKMARPPDTARQRSRAPLPSAAQRLPARPRRESGNLAAMQVVSIAPSWTNGFGQLGSGARRGRRGVAARHSARGEGRRVSPAQCWRSWEWTERARQRSTKPRSWLKRWTRTADCRRRGLCPRSQATADRAVSTVR